MQSSSLVSVIVISFLSAELITLSGAIGVVFGSNIGTTTTAWIVSAFGLKINIASFAMPMLIFGVIFRFHSNRSYQGIGNILVGLGFVFLGIGFMKDGFDSLKNGIDLAQFAIEGYLGIVVFILIGIVATIIIQSSSATMAIIITALASGQIAYENALALAIGANVGTTVTAIIGALASNANGKRLAVAHFIFNITTGAVAVVFIHTLASAVDTLASFFGMAHDDYAMKLSLFHTIFNIIGVILMTPMIGILVQFLQKLFVKEQKGVQRTSYLNKSVVNQPDAAFAALLKDSTILYQNGLDLIDKVLHSSKEYMPNIDSIYTQNLKGIYSDIIEYATDAQGVMDQKHLEKTYKIKVACRDIVEAVKDAKHMQKNIVKYLASSNLYIQKEYENIKKGIISTIDSIEKLKNMEDESEFLVELSKTKLAIEQSDVMSSGALDKLIRDNLVTSSMATSLMNDSAYAYDIRKNLLAMAEVMFFGFAQDKTEQKESIILDKQDIKDMMKENP
jgi:phosphate:Na+ symporter